MNDKEQGLSVDEIKANDLNPKVMARETAPRKTWFFKRLGDGYVFAAGELEAYEILHNRTNWMRRDFQIIGVSDGKTYAKIVKESKTTAEKVGAELEALENERSRFAKAEENMVFTELIDPDDESPENAVGLAKLKKMRAIIDKYDKRIADKHEEYRRCTSEVNKAAFEAELEVARGHVEWPSNQNILTPGADARQRQKILNTMGQGQ